jgi:Zn ribbon nucleic-acid-binding protein
MTYPKIKQCPKCGAAGDTLSVYTYEHGGRHVECNECHYLGPCGGSILSAIRLHNERSEQRQAS